MKSGFIAILGAPNAGKSSLLNAFVGEKVSIVSPKPQTTRDRITGILTDDDCQMIFVDTPGTIQPKNKLGEYMDKCIKSASDGCDAIIIVLDVTRQLLSKDIAFIEKYLPVAPVYIALNKIDLVGYEKVYPMLDKLSMFLSDEREHKAVEIVPISCKNKKNIDLLKGFIKDCLKDEVMYYDAEDISDKTQSFMAGEIIREKALWLLQEEVPHGIGVIIQSYKEGKKLIEIDADIVCEKESHKEIIIGDSGKTLKEIGTKARLDIESLTGKKIFLKLFVKVRKDWRRRKNIMDDLGYK